MNKNKKNFINKLKKETKEHLIDIICIQHEKIYKKNKQIEYLNSVSFSTLQSLKFALNNQNPTLIYEVECEDEEAEVKPDKKEISSYV